MIKKAVACVALIGAGLGILHLTIGFENFAGDAAGGDDASPIRQRDREIRGPIVPVRTDGEETAISFAGRGRLILHRDREIDLGGGRRAVLRVYTIDAEDSEPVAGADDLIRLVGLTVPFREIRRIGDTDEYESVPAGALRASEAFVQLGRDEKGRASVLEDREMDLRDVVLDTEPDSRIGTMHLEVERVLVKHGDDGLALRTPDATTPFTLTRDGDPVMGLTGLGLTASVPAEGVETGRGLELRVDRQPRLTRGDVTLSGTGRLDYRENVRNGIGNVGMQDDVVLEGTFDQDGSATRTVVRGSRLVGQIVRDSRPKAPGADEKTRETAAWRSLRIARGPEQRVSLEIGDDGGSRLTCAELTAQPGTDGSPWAFVANGRPRLVQAATGDGAPLTFEAADRIHVVLLERYLTPLHAPFGLHARAGSFEQLVIFEGVSTIRDPARELTTTASDGLHVLRSSTDGPLWVEGHGAVEVASADLALTSNNGFVLRREALRQVLRLGPPTPFADHRFHVERAGDRGFVLDGTGTCEIHQDDATGRGRVAIRSTKPDVDATFAEGTLRAMRSLDASLADGALVGFVARGDDVLVDVETEDGQLVGHAEVVEGDTRLVLLRAGDRPASLVLGDGDRADRLVGTVVGVWQSRSSAGDGGDGREDELLFVDGGDRHGPATIRLRGDPNDPERPDVDIVLTADHAAFLRPFLPRAARIAPLFGPAASPLRGLALAGIGDGPWSAQRVLVAHGGVQLVQGAGDESGSVPATARGDALFLDVERSLGWLVGEPLASFEWQEETGQIIEGRARALRLEVASAANGADSSPDDEMLRRQLGLLPEPNGDTILIVRGLDRASEDPDADTAMTSAFDSVRIHCRGPVQTEGYDIVFSGPVRVDGLRPDGSVDPEGPHLEADGMRLSRNRRTGQVEQVIASGRARLDWPEVSARGDELVLDLVRTTCLVRARTGDSEIALANGLVIRCPRVVANYHTFEYEAWRAITSWK